MDEYNKFFKINEFIRDNIYYCKNDFSCNGKESNSAVLLGLLTAALNGKMLFLGEYGLGKTTLSETISSLYFGIPLSVTESSSIKEILNCLMKVLLEDQIWVNSTKE